MSTYVLEQEQVLPIPLEEAWSFFSTPRNLARITPKDMGFRIEEPFDDSPMYTGQEIRYTVRPLFGIPMKWVTRIDAVEAPYRFVDTQKEGPYRLWHHEHRFESVSGGVRMIDRVRYELPLGPLGRIVHRLFVRERLVNIFSHRRKVLQELFPAQA
ncbi:MAG: SRPBCC family protein [Flavobacteriales bacterium]|nr:SRPBCC family protein [Flavobacteriales bacterium]